MQGAELLFYTCRRQICRAPGARFAHCRMRGATAVNDLLRPRLAAGRLLRWWEQDSHSQMPSSQHEAQGNDDGARASVATPVDAIVQRVGLEVATFHPAARRGGTLGWLEPGEDLIFVRDDLPESVRRFTLAHELGHAVLHRSSGPPASVAGLLVGDLGLTDADDADDSDLATGPTDPCDQDDLEAPLDALSLGDEALRPGQAYSARARRESEANAFAAALLLPAGPLRALFLGIDGASGLTPRALAERFGVSEEAAHQALAALLLPGAQDEDLPLSRPGGSTTRSALDGWQRAAAAAEAPALVVAGPGTGKTSTLVGRVAHLVFERGVEPSGILALTFSNKAAEEMRTRLALLLTGATDEARTAPGSHRGRPTVSTIHAFCGDLLRRYAPLVGLRPDFRLVNEAGGYLLLREAASEMPLTHYQPLTAPALHFPALLAAISRAKDELADPARYAELAALMAAHAHTLDERAAAGRALEVARVYGAYQDALDALGDADFGDLIRLAVRLLHEQPNVLAELRARYTHILVDEFQDINRAMGVLLRVLAGPDGPLWAVGDADQAIYRFRGASPANLARFTETYPGARVYTLGANYRSRPAILRAAAAVAGALLGEGERAPLEAAAEVLLPQLSSRAWERGEQTAPLSDAEDQGDTADSSQFRRRAASTREEMGLSAAESSPHAVSERVDRPTITLAAAPDEAAELAGLAAAIHERSGRGYGLSDQAVLCRTRRHSQRVAAALAAAGLPARIITPLLDQPDVKNILGVVLLLADASGAGLLRAGAIADHAFTRDDARAVLLAARERHTSSLALLLGGGHKLEDVTGLSSAGRAGLKRLGKILSQMWVAPDVVTGLARYVFGLTDLARRALVGTAPDERSQAANLARLLRLARAFEDQRRAAERVSFQPLVGGAHWDEFVDYVRVLTALGRDAVGGADDLLATATEGVRVLTVHGSKGLEFPVVYLPGLANGRFPTQRRADLTPPPPGLSDDRALEARDPAAHLAEEACLFYVALTRARDELVISRAERYGRKRYAPSPFLKPLEALAADPRSSVASVQWPAAPSAEPLPSAGDDEMGAVDAMAAGEPALREPMVPSDEALRPAVIETYQRCPRQYAYRYVYRLRPREIGLATLRRGVHKTLRDLQERFAAAAKDDPGPVEHPTLAEAQALFEQNWRAAVAAEAAIVRRDDGALGASDAAGAAEADGPFGALYRRHGRQVVERAWRDLTRERGLPQPMEADTAADSNVALANERPTDAGLAVDAVAAELPQPTSLPLTARLEQPVLVRVGGRVIEVTLDRVEGDARLGRDGRPTSVRIPLPPDAGSPVEVDAVAPPTPAPMRIVRHRLGRGGVSQADLRALLYALAAEQERGAAPAELFQHNLTTGELERVRLDTKRLARLRDELAEALAGMESGVYPARPDPTICPSCPFLLICPA
jgi:DNA helicase II / ATP-dependent DNA helicase PcrA